MHQRNLPLVVLPEAEPQSAIAIRSLDGIVDESLALPGQSAEVEGALLLPVELWINVHACPNADHHGKALILVSDHDCVLYLATFEELSAFVSLSCRLIVAGERID